jgi:hypothetical protein
MRNMITLLVSLIEEFALTAGRVLATPFLLAWAVLHYLQGRRK